MQRKGAMAGSTSSDRLDFTVVRHSRFIKLGLA